MYVQKDILPSYVTVWEYLSYFAALKLPGVSRQVRSLCLLLAAAATCLLLLAAALLLLGTLEQYRAAGLQAALLAGPQKREFSFCPLLVESRFQFKC